MNAPCRSCGRTDLTMRSWGLCATCYDRHHREHTLDLWRDTSREPVPALDVSWMESALCAEVDTEIFFPEKGCSTREGLSVCAECLVRAECLDYALTTQQRFGIWGGLSERRRRALLGLPADDDEPVAVA